MEKKFKKQFESLEAIFAFTGDYMLANKIDDAVKFSVDLVLEEFFTNMVKYNPESRNDVSIGISRDGNKLVLIMVDTDVEPFDVTRAPEKNTSAPLDERTPGGLGIQIAKKLMDSISYEYVNRSSKITFTKTLGQ
jgi:anti-sigma regulatory factor (Ser/Thr protein kinase)